MVLLDESTAYSVRRQRFDLTYGFGFGFGFGSGSGSRSRNGWNGVGAAHHITDGRVSVVVVHTLLIIFSFVAEYHIRWDERDTFLGKLGKPEDLVSSSCSTGVE